MTLKKFTLEELAKLTQSQLVGNRDHTIENVDNLESASSKDASFLANLRYKELMKKTQAGVVCISPEVETQSDKNYLVSDDPSKTFQQIAEILLSHRFHQSGFQGIHETAVIHESAQIGKGVTIGPHVVIDQGVMIGDNTVIHSQVSIGPGAEIGRECVLHSQSIVRERCILHNRVILQPGVVIGSCGYGYLTNPQTGRHSKLDQIGIVILEDDVEVGANSTIDRARFKQTLVKKGTKIDNLVQIAHNVELGENNLIVSQTGIAGSSKLGDNVYLGGQAGVVGHVQIANNVQVATRGGVSKSIKQSGIYGGSPVSCMPVFNKTQVHLRKIESYVKRIEKLEARLIELEKNSKGL